MFRFYFVPEISFMFSNACSVFMFLNFVFTFQQNNK